MCAYVGRHMYRGQRGCLRETWFSLSTMEEQNPSNQAHRQAPLPAESPYQSSAFNFCFRTQS